MVATKEPTDAPRPSAKLPTMRPILALAVIGMASLATFIVAVGGIDTSHHLNDQAEFLGIAEHAARAIEHLVTDVQLSGHGEGAAAPLIKEHVRTVNETMALLREGNVSQGIPAAKGTLADRLSRGGDIERTASSLSRQARALSASWENGATVADTNGSATDVIVIAREVQTALDDAQGQLFVANQESLANTRVAGFAGLVVVLTALFLTVVLGISPLQRAVQENTQAVERERDEIERRIQARTREFEKHARALERSNAELQRIATVAAHDLQEPLRSITSYMQLVEQRLGKDLDPTTLEYIDYALTGTARMKHLLGDLLAYTQVGTSEEELQRVELDDLLRDLLADLGPKVKGAGATVHIADNLPAILGHANEVREAFLHLILNSLSYRHPDREPEIRIDAKPEGERIRVTVADNGVGIDSRYADRVFQLFQRLHGTGEETEGTGIGLALCRKVMEHHDGRIWLESDGASGTTFHLLFHGPATPKEAIRARRTTPIGSPIEQRGRDLL